MECLRLRQLAQQVKLCSNVLTFIVINYRSSTLTGHELLLSVIIATISGFTPFNFNLTPNNGNYYIKMSLNMPTFFI